MKYELLSTFSFRELRIVIERHDSAGRRGVCLPAGLICLLNRTQLPLKRFKMLNETSFGVTFSESFISLIVNCMKLGGIILVMKLCDTSFRNAFALCQ